MNVLSNILKFKQFTHRPCFYLALAMGLGIYLGRYGSWSWPLWSILSGVFIILSLVRNKYFIFFLYLAVLSLGAFNFQSFYLFPSNHVSFLSYQDQKKLSAVEGVIDSDVQTKTTTFGSKKVFELKVSRINLKGHWQVATGRILVNFFGTVFLNYGDHLIVEGSLYKAFTGSSVKFSYQQYLEDHGIFLNLSVGKYKKVIIVSRHQGQWFVDLSFKIKHKFKAVLAQYLEVQEAGMIQAMVLGDRSFLTKDMYALFSKTGTSHILAISGMNMAIISAIVLFILKVLRFPRVLQFILTGVFLLVYALISGWSASVVRSVLMAIVILSSFCLEHEADAVNSLGVAALILFLLNPLNLFDVGFQLSFICVAIIVLFNPIIQLLIKEYIKFPILKYLAQAFFISLIAWIGISAMIAYEFEIVSFIAIIANIPVVILADSVIVLGLGVVGLGLCCPIAAPAFAGALKAVFNFMLILISWFAQIPGGHIYIHNWTLFYVFLYYGVIIIVYLVIPKNAASKP